jgi:alcohol dehydrogenase class IV
VASGQIVFQSPTRIICEAGAIHGLGRYAREYGSRGLLVSSASMKRSGYLSKAAEALNSEGLEIEVLEKGKCEPCIEDVDLAVENATSKDVHFVVGLGGGSVLDLAKGIAVALGNPGKARSYLRTGDRAAYIDKSTPPMIAVPSTAGTGSETSYYAVFTNQELNIKDVMCSPYIFPRLAILDPNISASAPKEVKRDVGIDTLTHAVEGYVSNKASPITDALAIGIISDVLDFLPRALYDNEDEQASRRLALASAMGGMVITSAGTGIGHALAQALGATVHIPHGFGVGVFLPWVLETNYEVLRDKLVVLYNRLGCDTAKTRVDDKARWFKRTVEKFYQEIGFDSYRIASYLSTIDIDLLEVARDTLKQPPAALNPAPVSESEIEQELRRLMAQRSEEGV